MLKYESLYQKYMAKSHRSLTKERHILPVPNLYKMEITIPRTVFLVFFAWMTGSGGWLVGKDRMTWVLWKAFTLNKWKIIIHYRKT